MKKTIIAILGLVLLSGCTGVNLSSNTPPATYYLLHAEPVVQKTPALVPIILEEPRMVAGLDTDRIALTKQDGRILDYYATAHWAAPLPRVLNDIFVESFSTRYNIVPRRARSLEANAGEYRVMITVRDFQAEYPNGTDNLPGVHIAFNVTLIDQKTGKTADEFVVRNKKAVAQNTLTAVTDAMEVALQESVSDMLNRLQTRTHKAR